MNNQTDNIDETTIGDNMPDNDEGTTELSMKESGEPQEVQESQENSEAVELNGPKESAGKLLKRAREVQGLSLDIVHEATKIPLDALRAIEEGYEIRMLSPFYYRGFVKMYADYLHIDAAEVIEDYKQEELPDHIDSEMEEFEIPLWITKFFTRERKQKIVIVIGVILALIMFFKIIGFVMSRKPQPPVKNNVVKTKTVKREVKRVVKKPLAKAPLQTPRKVIPKVKPKAAPKIVPKVAPLPPAPKPKPVKPFVVAPTPTVQKDITLTVRANQNSWLRVKIDGKVVFQSTLRLGAVETWIADEEIEISGRNINQLEFELNGKMIGTLGRKDHNAKKVVVTKNGLSVKK